MDTSFNNNNNDNSSISMIKLLAFLTNLLEKEQLYELAIFLGQNQDIIDQKTLLHIINDVNGFENRPEYKDIEEHFKKMDDVANNAVDIDGTLNISSDVTYDDFIEQREKRQKEIINKLLKDNNISLN